MKIYKTRRYPWQYLIYGASAQDRAKLAASANFTPPTWHGRKAPQFRALATVESAAELDTLGYHDHPAPVCAADWALAEEENRAADFCPSNNN